MNRPAPRRSSLAGSSPVAPPPVEAEPAPEEAPALIQAEPAAAAPQPGTSTAAAVKTPAKTKYPPKVSFYQDPADTDRMRAALLHTMATENYRNLSQFVSEAVMEKVARLEKAYNNGEPFGSVGARELPQGRPMGE